MTNPLQKKIRNTVLVLLGLSTFGTIGYMTVEKWPFIDALFMTITTLATVGYGETHPLTFQGRIFTMILIVGGVGTLLYVLNDTAGHLLSITDDVMGGFFKRKRMSESIANLNKHQIVCGFGRTGQEAAYWFQQNKVPFIVVELDDELCAQAAAKGYMVQTGDASEDDVLKRAGIERASGIVCALPDDAANTFIALAAKVFNEDIHIVCRAANPGSEAKMKRAGAHNVISPYVLAGRRMASAVTHPLVLDFLDLAMHNEAVDMRMEQVTISGVSALVGATLRDANIKQTAGAMVMAVTRGKQILTNPSPDFVFSEGDIMVALGNDGQLEKLKKLANPNG